MVEVVLGRGLVGRVLRWAGAEHFALLDPRGRTPWRSLAQAKVLEELRRDRAFLDRRGSRRKCTPERPAGTRGGASSPVSVQAIAPSRSAR